VNFAGVFSTNTPNYSACATSYRPFTHRLCCACALLRCADTTRSVRMNAPLQLTERFMRPHVTTLAQLPREKLISCASESAPVLAVTEYQAKLQQKHSVCSRIKTQNTVRSTVGRQNQLWVSEWVSERVSAWICIHRWSDVTESMVTIRAPFCRYNTI